MNSLFPFILVSALSPLADMAHGGEKPNILLILLDDLGYSDLGCYGGEIDTPHIDTLARGGVRFESFYNSARCCPSRASLMTGLYPAQAGIASFTTEKPSPKLGPAYLGRLNDQSATLAEVLKPAGYGCYYVGKWHLHPETGPIRRGFDEFYGFTTGYAQDQWKPDQYLRLPEGRKKEIDRPEGAFYATDVFNEYALEFIRQGQQRNAPWFLFLAHSSPHFPVQAPRATVDRYYERYLRGWDALREERYARMKTLGLVDGDRWSLTGRSLVPVDRDDIANGYSGRRNPAWDTLSLERRKDLARRMAVFAAMVDHVDQGVGRIVEHLQGHRGPREHADPDPKRQRRLLRVGSLRFRRPLAQGRHQAAYRRGARRDGRSGNPSFLRQWLGQPGQHTLPALQALHPRGRGVHALHHPLARGHPGKGPMDP